VIYRRAAQEYILPHALTSDKIKEFNNVENMKPGPLFGVHIKHLD
jgi:hypothetical protein